MKIIMIDDEKHALSELHEILLEHYPDAEVNCFTETAPAIEFLKNNTCDVAFVQCFGNFEVFCNGTPLVFKRSKAKELFAYLVNLRGAFNAETAQLRFLSIPMVFKQPDKHKIEIYKISVRFSYRTGILFLNPSVFLLSISVFLLTQST